MPLAGMLIVHLSPHVLLLLQHLANVLDHELAGLDVLFGKEAKALRTRPPLQSTRQRTRSAPIAFIKTAGC
jgi:hypothetical protein